MRNEIRRELILSANPETVWAKSFSTPDALLSWFPEELTGTFALGENFNLIWETNVCECRLIEYEPPYSLAYQWHPGDNVTLSHYPESELTSVRFTLEPHQTGTKLTLIESGFESISAARQQRVFAENDGGWTYELNELQSQYGN